MLKKPQTVERIKDKLISNVTEEKETFTGRYKRDMQTINENIKKIEEDYNLTKTQIESKEKAQLMESREQMDHEIKQVQFKFNKIFDEIKEKSRVKLDNIRQKQEEDLQESREKITVLENEFKTFIKTLETKQEEGLKKLQKISQQVDDVIERYENLTTTGYSVLEARNDWTAVQCIPDIRNATEALSKDIREFPELDTLSRTWVCPEIREDEESPVNFEGFQTHHWGMTGITGCDEGSIVITGATSVHDQSYITVINMKGKILHQKKINSTMGRPYCYCAYLSEYKVATVCERSEIGVFDIGEYSYIKKNISDVISSWPEGRIVKCVTTDPMNNHILVGGYDSRDVYVFDDQLNYHHTLTLPEMCPYDMTTSEGNLLICNYFKGLACIVSMNGRESEIIHKFTKPDFDGDDLNPINVCTDMNGFVYILWMTGINYTAGRRIITQYTQDGLQLLTTKHIDANDARYIATVMTGMTVKLLVATYNTAKLYIFSIW